MDNTAIAIPSLKRAKYIHEEGTLKFLKGKVDRNLIHIFVANEKERDEYYKEIPKKMYGEIVIGELGLFQQRSFIKKYFDAGMHVVSFDDDVQGMLAYKGEGIKELDEFTRLEELILASEELLIEKGLTAWSVTMSSNPFYMDNAISINLRILLGTCHGYIVSDDQSRYDILPYATKYKINSGVEDILETLNRFTLDGHVLTWSNICLDTNWKGNEGGIQSQQSEKKREVMQKLSIKRLAKDYPDLIEYADNSVGYKFKRKGIKRKIKFDSFDSIVSHINV